MMIFAFAHPMRLTYSTVKIDYQDTRMMVPGMLAAMRRFDRLQEVLLIDGSLSLLGAIFCTFLPATGAYAYYASAADLVAGVFLCVFSIRVYARCIAEPGLPRAIQVLIESKPRSIPWL